MDPRKKAEREKAKLAALFGIDMEVVKASNTQAETRDDRMNQAQAVVRFLTDPKRFIRKECRTCKNMFVTDYKHIDTCSMQCLKDALESLGLVWNPDKSPEERWGTMMRDYPLIVPPQALRVIRDLLGSENSPEATLALTQ